VFWTYTFFFEQSACWCRLFWRNRSRKPLLQIRPWRDRAPARFAESQLCLASHIAMLATCLIGIAFLLPTFVCTHQFPLMTALKSHYSRHFALNQLLSGRSSARFGSARTGARVAQHMRSQIAFGDFPSHDAGTPSPARSGWVDTSEHDR